jgi:UPF0145 protein lwe0170
MILTTTPSVQGHNIIEYKDIVFGEVITGANFMKDFGAGLRDFFGGRAQGYEKELISAREDAIREMENRANKIGANAIVGVHFDYEFLGDTGSMMMVTVSGTAVVID